MKKTVLVIVALVVAMLLVNQELSAQANQRTRYFCGRGQVVSIDGDKSGITIAHQAIEGYMSAMTMHFQAADLEVLGYVGAGDRVRFTLKDTPELTRLVYIERVMAVRGVQTVRDSVVRLHAVSTCWKVESMEIR